MLLRHGARMERDAYGMTPLLAAAISGYTKIVEFLISRQQCPKSERISALELLGATYVDKKRDMLGALNFWRQAMEERYSDSRNPIVKPINISKVAAYENAEEVRTLEQLDELISDPDDMRMQALLVRERILGPAHPDTSYYIRYRGALYADMGNFDRCITLWMYALDMQQGILEPLSPMTQSSFLSFAELFSFMTTEWRSRPTYLIAFSDIMAVLTRAVDELERGGKLLSKTDKPERDLTNCNRLLVIIMHLLCLMCRIQTSLTSEEEHLFKRKAYKLVHMHPKGEKSSSPLHLACSRDTTHVGRYPVCSFPSAEVVRLLVEVGAPVDDKDDDNNTPLHIAASNRPCKSEVIRALLGSGAHIDACNCDRKTPMQLIRGLTIYDIVSPLNYLSLQCLAARKIVKCGIPYQGQVPKKMETFVEMH